MSQSIALLLLGASGLLVWAGIRNQSPVTAVRQVIAGGGATGPRPSNVPAGPPPAPAAGTPAPFSGAIGGVGFGAGVAG